MKHLEPIEFTYNDEAYIAMCKAFVNDVPYWQSASAKNESDLAYEVMSVHRASGTPIHQPSYELIAAAQDAANNS